MAKQSQKNKYLMLVLTLALALFGAAGRPGKLGISIVCVAMAVLVCIALSDWASGRGLFSYQKIGRWVLLLVGSFSAAAFYGWQYWPAEPKPTRPQTPTAKRAHLHVDSFEFLPMKPQKPIGVNIFYRNDGDADMDDQHIYALIARTAPASAPAESKTVEDYLWDKFTNSPRQPVTSSHKVPAHSMGLWTTLYGEPLTGLQEKRLTAGAYTVWFMGSAVYKDSVGEQTTEFCVYYNGNPKVVFSCTSHNGDVGLPQT